MWDVCISSGISNTSQNGEKCPPFPSSLHLSDRESSGKVGPVALGTAAMNLTALHPCGMRARNHKDKFQGKKILRVFRDWQIVVNIYTKNDTEVLSERKLLILSISIARFNHFRRRPWLGHCLVRSECSFQLSEVSRREKFLSLLCMFIQGIVKKDLSIEREITPQLQISPFCTSSDTDIVTASVTGETDFISEHS